LIKLFNLRNKPISVLVYQKLVRWNIAKFNKLWAIQLNLRLVWVLLFKTLLDWQKNYLILYNSYWFWNEKHM